VRRIGVSPAKRIRLSRRHVDVRRPPTKAVTRRPRQTESRYVVGVPKPSLGAIPDGLQLDESRRRLVLCRTGVSTFG
jgi:hypothetical protein